MKMKEVELIKELKEFNFSTEKESPYQMVFSREETDKSPKIRLIINKFACGNYLIFDSIPINGKYNYYTDSNIKEEDIKKEISDYLERILIFK